MLISLSKNDSSLKLMRDNKLKEHFENVIGSEPYLDLQRSVEMSLQ
jgi:hypothetical protein